MLRPVHIRRYVTMMRARSIDEAAVLKGSGIDPSRLEDPSYLVSPQQCSVVVNNMIRLSGDPGLGFAFGQASRLTEIGIIGHAFLSSRTMRQVVSLWVSYGNSLAGSLLRVGIEEHTNGDWSLRIVDSSVRGAVYTFCVEDFLVFGTRFGGQLAGSPFVARRLRLPYERPVHAQLYEDYFRCPIEFGANEARITLSSPHLDQPLHSDHDVLNDICVNHCQRVMQQIANQSPLISRLRNLFLQSTHGLPSMQQAAAEVGLSVRSLRRHLLREGTSYQALLDQFRRDLAIEYLDTGQMTPKEVAYRLGFKFPNTFRRAFRQWTGQTVGEYLRQRVAQT